MEKNPDITNPRYNDHILPVLFHFIISGFHFTPKVPTGQNLSELYILPKNTKQNPQMATLRMLNQKILCTSLRPCVYIS